jgi:hypothetical protein
VLKTKIKYVFFGNPLTVAVELPPWEDVQSYNVVAALSGIILHNYVVVLSQNTTKYFHSSSWSNIIYFEIPIPKYSLLVVKPASVASNLPVIVTDSLNRELHTNSKYVHLPPRTNTTILCTAPQ